jgi:hypothetical protein
MGIPEFTCLGLSQAKVRFGERNKAPNEFGVTPEEDISYIIKMIKGVSAREINKYLERQGNLWKHRFYDFNIYSQAKFEEKLDYIHKNPVKAGLTKELSQYKYCSWRNYHLDDQSIFEINFIEY